MTMHDRDRDTGQDALPFDDSPDIADPCHGRPVELYTFETAEGYAAECITADGQTVLWMMSVSNDTGNRQPPPPHERLGKLPRDMKLALGFQCAHVRTRDGHRCRQIVPAIGDLCPQHKEAR